MDSGPVLTPSSVGVLQRTVNDVVLLKQAVKQMPLQTGRGLPVEIFVPRSEAAGIYTGDLYWYDPETETLELLLEDQTAELMPDTV